MHDTFMQLCRPGQVFAHCAVMNKGNAQTSKMRLLLLLPLHISPTFMRGRYMSTHVSM